MRKLMLERRKMLGLSQQIVADRAGLTRSNYAHIERGRHEPSLEQMECISKALNIKKPSLNFFKNYCDETYRNNKQAASQEVG
jgi:transcriptional regulator with XRE-family HTH domain